MNPLILVIVLSTTLTALLLMLTLLRIGIWRQERAESSAQVPDGLCGSLRRHLLGLNIRYPGRAYPRGCGHVSD